MELKEILEQQAEVKNYKNDRPCDFRKLLKKADSGNVKAMYDAVRPLITTGLRERIRMTKCCSASWHI